MSIRAIFSLEHDGQVLRFDPERVERGLRRQERAEGSTLFDLHKTIEGCEPPPPDALESMTEAERAMVAETSDRRDQSIERFARIAMAAFDAAPIGQGADGQIEMTEAEAIAALNAYWQWSDDLQKKREGSPDASPTIPDSAATSTS